MKYLLVALLLTHPVSVTANYFLMDDNSDSESYRSAPSGNNALFWGILAVGLVVWIVKKK